MFDKQHVSCYVYLSNILLIPVIDPIVRLPVLQEWF